MPAPPASPNSPAPVSDPGFVPFSPVLGNATLFGAVLEAMARHGKNKVILEDIERQPMTYGRLVLGSLVLGRILAAQARPGEPVGVLLPNVAGLAVTILGLNAHGRVAALLNFTAGLRNLASAVKTAPTSLVVTSRRFVEQAKLEDVVAGLAETEVAPGRKVRILYLEDVRKTIGTGAKIGGLLRSFIAGTVARRHGMRPDKTAVILFTSGTEGTPKGVALTNANLVSNARQIWRHAAGMLSPADTAMNPLPMFHSFGLTAGTLLGLVNGMKVVLYPSPLHYKQIPGLIAATRSTVLFATDTFLQGYARAAEPGELASVRFVIAGAEKVKDATRAMWARSGATGGDAAAGGGALILEGYGATECSPVIACNLPQAHRPGSVGRVLPGIEIRLEPVDGIAEGGRLLVRGPNVMAGYIQASSPGVVQPPRDGWHDTGDIVTIDDGFITIAGRAKRFAKIGGEMVSLAAVEQMAATVWPDNQHVVLAQPDPRKGEQLVIVTDKADADRESLLAAARAQGFPELWVPRSVVKVPAIPILGSGKIDFAATSELVRSSRPPG